MAKAEQLLDEHVISLILLFSKFLFFFLLLLVAIRKEFTRRAQSASAQVHERMAKAEQLLEEHVEDQKAINAGLYHLYVF